MSLTLSRSFQPIPALLACPAPYGPSWPFRPIPAPSPPLVSGLSCRFWPIPALPAHPGPSGLSGPFRPVPALLTHPDPSGLSRPFRPNLALPAHPGPYGLSRPFWPILVHPAHPDPAGQFRSGPSFRLAQESVHSIPARPNCHNLPGLSHPFQRLRLFVSVNPLPAGLVKQTTHRVCGSNRRQTSSAIDTNSIMVLSLGLETGSTQRKHGPRSVDPWLLASDACHFNLWRSRVQATSTPPPRRSEINCLTSMAMDVSHRPGPPRATLGPRRLALRFLLLVPPSGLPKRPSPGQRGHLHRLPHSCPCTGPSPTGLCGAPSPRCANQILP
jgi:hypothetical protein